MCHLRFGAATTPDWTGADGRPCGSVPAMSTPTPPPTGPGDRNPALLPPARGRLLVATPDLDDPNFAATVVLLLDHGDEGSIGIVLNRPSTMPVAEAMGEGPGDGTTSWEDLVPDVGVVHVGGPVEPNAIVALARSQDVREAERWEPVVHDVGVMRIGDGPVPDVGPLRGLRVFAGYAGWGPGQLDDEVAAGAWYVLESHPGDGFADDAGALWGRVLRRLGGVFTTATAEPVLN